MQETLGTRMKRLRTEMGLTQKELGDKINKNYSTISHYEKDLAKPDTDTLPLLARIFGVSLDYLLCLTNERNPESKYFWTPDELNVEKELSKTNLDVLEIVKLIQLKEELEKHEITPQMLSEILDVIKKLKRL